MNGMRSFIWAALPSLIIGFWAAPARAAIGIDATASRDAASPSATVSTLPFSTTSPNELLLAFVSADSASSSSTSVTNIAGGGLTWALVQRTNAQLGTAEIWRAFASSTLTNVTVTATLSQRVVSSITVMSFSGVDTSGVNGIGAVGAIGTGNGGTGAPNASLVTTRAGSLVLGVGNDWDNAIARTVGGGQVLVHQDLASVGDTYWVQRQGSPLAPSGASVTINDTAPTGDRYNLSIVEVLASSNQTAAPDLTVTKNHSGAFVQGQSGASYTITVTNSGGTATSGTVTVTDTLPASLTPTTITGTGWTCTLATLTCTRGDTLAAAASYPAITLTVNVASNAPGSVTNTATVSGGGETNTANDTANDATTITVITPPDLTIIKSHSGNFVQGQTGATYTITVTNSGGSGTSGTVSLTDTLPASLTPTAISGTGWTCTLATLTCTRGDGLAAAASYPPIVLTVNVAGNAPNSVTNIANVSGGGETNTSNDTASDVTTITISAPPDLTIIKRHSGNFAQGQTGASYTITVTNSGGTATSGIVSVTDTLPASLTPTTITGTGWTCTLATLTCTRGDTLAAAASYPAITLTVNVASNAPGSVTNTATVSGGGETNTANDTANDLTTVTPGGALIHVGGAAGHPTVTNQMFTFGYTPVKANDALVLLIACISPGVTSMSLTAPGWVFTPISGLVGPSGSSDFISTFGAITPNTTPVTFTVTLTGGNGTCSNDTAILVDEFSGNDITGGTTTFDAHAESLDGPGVAVCTGASVTPANNNDAIWFACFDNVTGVSGSYIKGQDDTIGDWSEYKILLGGSRVTQSPGFVTNSNFSTFALGGVSIKPASSVADLTIAKAHSGAFVQGQTAASYTISITNSGGAATSGTVTVTDTLPASLIATAIGGTGWTCTLATLTCTRGDALTAAASYPPIALTVNVAANAPNSVTNFANVSGGGETNTSNDTASDVTTITISGSPDLTIIKSHSGNFAQGQTGASYAITVTNSGGAATSGTVSVTDTLPASLTPTAISGTGWTCTLGTLTCTRSDTLAAAANYPVIALSVNVASNAPSSVTNTATVSGGGETNTSNDTANDNTLISPAGGTSTILLDVNVSMDQSTARTTVMTPAFSTTTGSELLLAFIAGDYQPSQSSTNLSVTSVSGGGLTWVLVKRTNTQAGSAEIWRAFAPSVLTNVTVTATLSQSVESSITVLSFAGVDTTGTNGSGAIGAIGSANASSGAPSASLVTTRSNSWVFGVGNDYDNAIARTPGSGQKLVHQDLAPINDTYWVQMENAATALSGTSVTINDTTPTSDRYNLTTVEVLPSAGGGGGTTTYGISGIISPTANGAGATVSLSGAASGSAIADANGNYAFSGLSNGSYALTPTKNGFAFTPSNQNVILSGANLTSVNFTAQPVGSSGIKLVQANTNGNENGTANMSVAFRSSNTAGNFLIVTGTAARPASNLSVSDSLGNSYSPAIGPVTDIGQDVTLYVWYVPACRGGANTVTIVPSGISALEIHVSEWSGLATTNPVDATAFATGTGTNVSSGSKSTTSNGELILGYGWVFNTATAGSGFTPISVVNGDLDEYQIQTFAGDIAATFTQASGTWGAVMATFKSQASVTGPNVSMTSPAPNATVTSNATVSANASDQSSSITGVQFLLDGSNLGARATAPPYSLTWDTTTATAGIHTLSATVFDSAGLSANAVPITVAVDNSGNAAIVGSWSAPVTIPTVAVNLLLLKNNTLMFYEDGVSATVWDYLGNKFTTVPTSTDLFCSGDAVMADGRVLAVGGYGQSSSTMGIANAEIFDPSSNSWTAVPAMAFRRWYPTATTLSDGRILVTAGWQTTNHTNAGIPEIYDPVANTWTQLTNANNPFETYPFMFLLSDGRIIHTGGTEVATNTDVLDINAQTWTVLDSRIVDGGSATMYSPGKILKAGSAADSQSTGPSSNTAFLLDTTQSSPAWQQVPSMAYPRSFLNLTTLPDGTVLATGGETDKNGGNISNAVYASELWSPRTQTWTTMASMHTPREYHSTALLLPDGRVLQSGMGADFGNVPDEMTAEFYSPPYLFKGPRPTITQAPAQIQFATNFFVATPDAPTVTTAVLIRTGAVTHFFDQNTRFVPVTFQQSTGGLTLTAPANGLAAPPGYYMLFLVNSSGVPSVAPIIQLTQ
jgi:uncharacterized repeat protein (TIGR01451 family)